jgi:cytochrome c5
MVMRRSVLGAMGLAGTILAGGANPWATNAQAAAAPALALQRSSFQQSSAAAPVTPQRALLTRYCVTCHNQKLKTAQLTLDTANVENVAEHAEVWEKVARKLRAGAMPPAGLPRPDQASMKAFISHLETSLDRDAAARPNPGRPTAHRLNRNEYVNAIRELLAVEIDGASLLPADDAAYGFDNNADILALSPALLERYLSAARKIGRLAIGDPTIRPTIESYSVPKGLVQDDHVSDQLPFGSRGGYVVRHNFPLDGEYLVKVRLRRDYQGGSNRILEIEQRDQIDIRMDRVRVANFTLGGPPPAGQQGTYAQTADEALQVRLPVKAGARSVAVSFVNMSGAVEGLRPTRGYIGGFAVNANGMAVDNVEISGPYGAETPADSASRQRIFLCTPASPEKEEPCAKTILSALARRAYRRPVTSQDVDTLLGFYRTKRAAGDFNSGIQAALERLLVDPDFLFRIELAPSNQAPGTIYRVSDLELASRLSFFLWSSLPDEELLKLAEQKKLSDPAVLEQQVKRMLADARSSGLVSNFGAQWLHLRNLRTHAPDVNAFPDFDDNLREAFLQETELFLASQLREDRSVLDLLTANYTFVNERLANHYGIPNVFGTQFRRVSWPDGKRAGLLGHGSILTVTSYPHRTSPVVRGKWLMENILGVPPPPPPANVPALKEKDEDSGGRPLSVRERTEAHRKNPACSVCHVHMDPLGFALENFDAIGRWRDTEDGAPIDSSAVLVDGTKFSTADEFRGMLMNRRDEFLVTFAEKLLTYALGRGVEYYDMPTVRAIVRDVAPSDYRWSAFVMATVKSLPFQRTVR